MEDENWRSCSKRFEEKRFAIFVFSHTLKNINWMNLG